MQSGGAFADLVDSCRECGSEMAPADFAEACRRLAHTLAPDFDVGLLEHLEVLLAKGDRLAAALLILPSTWGYRIAVSCEGRASAALELPAGRGTGGCGRASFLNGRCSSRPPA